MKMTLRAFSLIMMTAMSVVQADAAQEIKAKPDKVWLHKGSGFAFPATSGAFVRRDMTDISDGKQIDISATYDDPSSGSVATLYLYRPAMPDPALWFDVSNWFLQRSSRFGQVKPAGGPTAFRIAESHGSAALRQSHSITEIGRSSGVAIIPLGPWLMKLRLTSRAFEPGALDQAMRDFLVSLPWPTKMPAANDTVPITSCSAPLDAAPATEIKQENAVILLGAIMASKTKEPAEPSATELPVRLCRDDSLSDSAYPLYQLDEGRTGYVLALGDNGTLLSVRDDRTSASVASELAGNGTENAAPFYRVTIMTPERWEQYPAFAQLPSPSQAMDITRQRRPLSVTSILGKGSKIELDSESFK